MFEHTLHNHAVGSFQLSAPKTLCLLLKSVNSDERISVVIGVHGSVARRRPYLYDIAAWYVRNLNRISWFVFVGTTKRKL